MVIYVVLVFQEGRVVSSHVPTVDTFAACEPLFRDYLVNACLLDFGSVVVDRLRPSTADHDGETFRRSRKWHLDTNRCPGCRSL